MILNGISRNVKISDGKSSIGQNRNGSFCPDIRGGGRGENNILRAIFIHSELTTSLFRVIRIFPITNPYRSAMNPG